MSEREKVALKRDQREEKAAGGSDGEEDEESTVDSMKLKSPQTKVGSEGSAVSMALTRTVWKVNLEGPVRK